MFSGRVTDVDGIGLPGAAVVLTPGGAGVATDVEGNFYLGDLCPGRYHVHVHFIGYEEVAFDIHAGARPVTRVVRMKAAAMEINEVVIHHHDETLTEHAANYAVLDGSELFRTAGKSLGESLGALPGVTTLNTGPGIAKPVIHGLHSNRILILNHGIRQEGQQWGMEHAPEIDPFIAANLVVIKDASAIKFGAGALGGVVVVNPPALPESGGLGGSVQTVLQSNGRSGIISGAIEGGIGKRHGWGWRLQGTGKRSGDFHTPDYHLTNTGLSELNFSAAAGYHAEVKGFDVYFSRFQTTLGVLKGTSVNNMDDLVAAMERTTPLYTRDFSYTIGAPRQEVKHDLLKIKGHITTNRGDWRMQYGYQNNARQEFDIRVGGLSHIPSIDLSLKTHTLDVEWETLHSEKRTFSTGVNAMYQDNDNVPGTQRIPFIPDFNTGSVGAFGVAGLYFENVALDFGARVDYRYYDVKGFDFKNNFYRTDLSFFNASATVGATWLRGAGGKISVNMSTAWRPPHVSELFSVGVHQSAASIEYGLLLDPETNEVMQNHDDLHAEQAFKLVGTYQKSWDRFMVEVTPYANYILDYIHLRPRGVTRTVRGVYPYFRYRQADAFFAGVDAMARWSPGGNISVLPKASLLYAENVTNRDILPMIPPNQYAVALQYEPASWFGWSDIRIAVDTRYVSKQGRAPDVVTVAEIADVEFSQATFDFMPPPDGYWLLGVSIGASKRMGNTRLDFRVAIENALNQQYRDYTNRLRYYADEPGRNFVFSVKYIR